MTLKLLPIRGGNWNNAGNAGVFALNLNNARSIVSTNVGFRAALALTGRHIRKRVCAAQGLKGLASLPAIGRKKIEFPQGRLVDAHRRASHAGLVGGYETSEKHI